MKDMALLSTPSLFPRETAPAARPGGFVACAGRHRYRPLRTGALGRRRTGFTLVEVALALGIIAMAFVPVLGLLPVGLDVSRKAIDATIASQIVQKLTNEAQQTDFSTLSTLSGITSYFDDQGIQLPDTTNVADAIYAAGFSVSTATSLPANVTTQRLATVTISILNTKASRSDKKTDPNESRDSHKYVLLIPDNGR